MLRWTRLPWLNVWDAGALLKEGDTRVALQNECGGGKLPDLGTQMPRNLVRKLSIPPPPNQARPETPPQAPTQRNSLPSERRASPPASGLVRCSHQQLRLRTERGAHRSGATRTHQTGCSQAPRKGAHFRSSWRRATSSVWCCGLSRPWDSEPGQEQTCQGMGTGARPVRSGRLSATQRQGDPRPCS